MFALPICSLLLVILLPVRVSGDNSVEIDQRFIYDEQDRNEWGPQLGGEEIQAEWGELVHFKALPGIQFDRAVIHMWNITNLADGSSTIFQGEEITLKFYPSNRIIGTIQEEKFLVELTVWHVRSMEMAARTHIQLWVVSDDDNDNDGMPDDRERYYWGEDIFHHPPDYDEDGDGWTNLQEIGFDIPLAYSERGFPYVPPIGHFDPTDPDSPTPRTINNTVRPPHPGGPVMPIWAIYTLVGGIALIGVIAIVFCVVYIKFSYLTLS